MEKLRHREWRSHRPVPVVQYGLCSLYVGDTYTLASTDGNIDFCWFSVQSSGMVFWGKCAKPPSGFGVAQNCGNKTGSSETGARHLSPQSTWDRLLCLRCGCLPRCPLTWRTVQWLTPGCSVDKGPFNLADKHCGRGGLEISYVLEAMTSSLGSTEQLLHHRAGRWIADERVCPQVVCTSRSPSESHGPGISSRRKRSSVESRCNTKPQTHTLVQLARSKYNKGVNRFKKCIYVFKTVSYRKLPFVAAVTFQLSRDKSFRQDK